MFWLSPFHYILEAFLGAINHNSIVHCADNELSKFTPPKGMSCEEYVKPFIKEAGGSVQTASNGLCEFCQFASGDEFAKSQSIYYDHIWRDSGIVVGFILFNYAVVYFATFLRFRAKNPLKKKK